MSDYLSEANEGAAELPNTTTTLILGILSIVICFVCGIVALVLSKKDLTLYKANPEAYTLASYNNIKAGRVCAVIGIILQITFITIYLVWVYFMISKFKEFR